MAKDGQDAMAKDADLIEPVKPGATVAPVTLFGKVKKAALHGVTFDIHEVIEEDKQLHEMHNRAEVFEPRIEMSFSYLQVNLGLTEGNCLLYKWVVGRAKLEGGR